MAGIKNIWITLMSNKPIPDYIQQMRSIVSQLLATGYHLVNDAKKRKPNGKVPIKVVDGIYFCGGRLELVKVSEFHGPKYEMHLTIGRFSVSAFTRKVGSKKSFDQIKHANLDDDESVVRLLVFVASFDHLGGEEGGSDDRKMVITHRC